MGRESMALRSSLSRTKPAAVADRMVTLGGGLPPVPERLLLDHARGRVLFIAGAGISRAAGMPDFRNLVIDVYDNLDKAVHAVIRTVPANACNQWTADLSRLTNPQAAEVRRFISGDYDVVLGMLERRMDGGAGAPSSVRKFIVDRLTAGPPKPTPIHRSLMQLADRGAATAIATTNFECLLEEALPAKTRAVTPTHSLLHIHGVIDKRKGSASDLVISDHDFGEFYLRRRVVPDFIYDAARLYNLVLVGYSVNDPPMRYLLNSVAADGKRFEDMKERFIIISGTGTADPVQIEDWKGRGITPVYYDSRGHHTTLVNLLGRWADLSGVNGNPRLVEREIQRLVAIPRRAATLQDQDLFDHLVRRGNESERIRLIAFAAKHHADTDWLDAALKVVAESPRGLA
jgi:hypothetical protein